MIHKHLRAFFAAMDHRIKIGLALLVMLVTGITLSISPATHASISNGKNAFDELGMYAENLATPTPVFTKGKDAANDAPNRRGINTPRAMAVDTVHHRFFLADANNGRVLVYNLNTDNTFPDRLPDNVLGQPDFITRSPASPTASNLSAPYGIAYDSANDRLFVTDSGYHRVMIYDTASITNGEAAVHILGKSSYTTAISGLTASTMNTPAGLAYDAANNRLFVSEALNNRVLVFDVTPGTLTDGQAAAHVLGQSNFTTNTATTTQTGLSRPLGMGYDATRQLLFVGDNNNNRLMIFDVNSIVDGQNAAFVLGKGNFTSISGFPDDATMLNVSSAVFDPATKFLYVAQGSSAQRVSVFDTTTLANGQAATHVLGKPDFFNSTGAAAQDTLNPSDVTYDGTTHRLYVSDFNSRVMVFDVTSISDGQPAVDVFGRSDGSSTTNPQPEYTRTGGDEGPNQYGLASPQGVALDTVHHRFFVADTANRRIAVYNLNTDNTFPDRIIDNVLGQPNIFTNSAVTASATSLITPYAVAYDSLHDRLFVADGGYHRVLVYDTASITNGEAAVNVLGQTTFTASGSANSQIGMNLPYALAYDAVHEILYVAQFNGNRVTTYDVNPATIANGEAAQHVLGQSTFGTNTAALTQTGMGQPNSVALDPTTNLLFVGQGSQNRVLVYNVASISDGQPATKVLGQANFTTSTGVTAQNSTRDVKGLLVDSHQRLFVSQGNSAERVTVFSLASLSDNMNASFVLGRANFTTSTEPTVASQSSLSFPYGMAYDPAADTLYVAESLTSRVSFFEVAPVPDVIVTQSGGTTAVTEGGATDSFTVVLATQPASDVVLNVSSSDPTSATVDQATLTFTNANWNTPQTVTVSAPEDDDVVSETPTITIAVNDPLSDDAYDPVADKTVNVTVTDNDTAGFTVTQSGGTTNVTEGGATDSFDVVLTAQPSSNVVFNVSSNDTTAATVSPSTLTFTTGNWNTPQTVTVTAPEDDDVVSETPIITISVDGPSSDNAWDPLPNQTVNVTVTDNDTAGFTVTQSGGTTNVTEGGATDSFDVVLTAQPSSNVVFSVSSNDTTAATVDLSTLTFTTANWNTPQTVTVTAPEDADIVSETPTITVSVVDASSDDAWDPLADQTVSVNVTDNDIPGFTVTQSGGTTNVTEGGATDSFDVVLTAQPSSNVVFDVSSNDTSSATVSPATLTFTPGNWNTPQTVTVTAPEDANIISETPTVTVSVNDAASDDAWDPLADQTVTVNVTDNDTANFSITESAGSTAVTEGGATDSFDVVLTAQPSSNVVFDISSNDTSAATVSPATLTFTPGNWNTPQTVTVTAPEDPDIISETPVITVSVNDAASDNAWDPLADKTVNVAVTDNDTAGFTVTQSGGTTNVTEGGATDSFDVVLTAQPSSNVVFDVSSNDTSSATVSPATLTFTPGNWNTPQTITVTAPQDADVVSETPTVTVAVNDPASDDAWDPLSSQVVNVNVTDDDVADFTVTQTSGTTEVTEGGATDSFDVVLTAQPSSNVVFDISSNDTTSATVSPATLTFTTVNWNTPQTVTVTAPQDSDSDNETPVITIAVNDAASDDDWDGVADKIVNVSVTDDDPVVPPTPPAAPVTPFTGGGGGFSASAPEENLHSAANENANSNANDNLNANGNANANTNQNVNDNTNTATGSRMGQGGGGGNSSSSGAGGGFSVPVIPQDTRDYVATLNALCVTHTPDDAVALQTEHPEGHISRAELVKILVLCKQVDMSGDFTQSFSDIPLNHPSASYIYAALKNDIVTGYPDGTFHPDADITREEATKMILLAHFDGVAGKALENATPFVDVVPGEWYAQFVSFAFNRGFVTGYLYPDGTPKNLFGVGNSITRGEAAKVIVNVFGL